MKTYFLRLFSRPSQNYKAIDGIRAIAILWVITFHAWAAQNRKFPAVGEKVYESPFSIWISKGDLGVDLFFVISGFLIGTILFKELKKTNTLNFKKFYTKRLLRLMPVYVFSMVIGLYFIEGNAIANLRKAWSNLLYINNFVRDSYMRWTWSLAIEEQFYIVIPVLIAFVFPLFKNKLVPFAILALTTLLLRYHYVVNIFDFKIPYNFVDGSGDWGNWFWGYYGLTHLRYGVLLCGVAGAYLNVYHQDKVKGFFVNNRPLCTILFCSSLLVFFIISSITLGEFTNLKSSIFDGMPTSIPRTYEIIYRELFAYAVLFIILSCLYLDSKVVRPVNMFLSSKLFYPIAQISYSAYLFHPMFNHWFFSQFNAFALGSLSDVQIVLSNGVISLVATLIVATLMYIFIEQPFQDIKEKMKFKTATKIDPPKKITLQSASQEA
jgi:peptidoglycan/LPS O-acetylase OafA/YrhL